MRILTLAAFVTPLAVLVTLQAAIQAVPLSQPTRFEFSRPLMGTDFRIVLYAVEPLRAQEAAAAAYARVAELEAVLSDFDPGSELRRLSATAGSGRWIDVSDDLWEVLEAAQRWAVQTAGAFDVTVGPLTRLWRWADRRGVPPPPRRVEVAARSVGYDRMDLDPVRRRVRLSTPGMQLDAGGIGKGFAADGALSLLRESGIRSALIDAGGDLVLGEPPPGRSCWDVEVPSVTAGGRLAREVVCLAEVAVATSGDWERHIEADGVRYSHIVDPRTGSAVEARRVTTVVAPTGTSADVLASAFSVLGADDVDRVLRWPEGVSARIVYTLNGPEMGWRVWERGAQMVRERIN